MPLDQLIPVLDPNPLPAPYFVFKALLLVTLFLHLLAMNLAAGGALLAAVLRGGAGGNLERRWAADELARKIPVFLPAAITLGVAPLLFLQSIYAPFFYSATILMGWPWLGVLLALTIAYYTFYYASFRSHAGGAPAWALWLGTALLAVVGFVYVNAMTLSQVPQAWSGKYFSDPAGWNLNLGEPSLVPRLLHFALAAVALGGLLLCYLGSRPGRPAYALRVGARAFVYATLAQVLVGFWFLTSLPRSQRLLLLGDNLPATALWGVGLVGALGAVAALQKALRDDTPRKLLNVAAAITAGVVLLMVVLRDLLRDTYLAPYLHREAYAVKTQWDVFLLFLVLFLAGVGLWAVMVRRFVTAPVVESTRP